MTKSCAVEEGFVLNMGRMQDVAKMEEEVTKMLREVRKVVEQQEEEEEEEMKKKEESRGIPKPSFMANLVAIQHNMSECSAPRKKKKAKKTVRFLLSTVSKRKLQMEEEEVEMSSLKKVKEEEEGFLADELEQIGSMMAKMLPRQKK